MQPGAFRFLLAFTVVLFHVTEYVFFGVAAVYVFFVLSGYWIIKMYNEKYSKFKNPYTIFLLSRLWRLFPIYLTSTLLVSIFIYLNYCLDGYSELFQKMDFTSHLSNVIILGYNQLERMPLISAWSLDIELQFYILFPIIFLLLMRQIQKFLIFSILSSIFLVLFAWESFLFKTILFYLPFFFLGMLAYVKKWRPTPLIINISLVLIFLSFLLLYIDFFTLQRVVQKESIFYIDLFLSMIISPLAIATVYKKSADFDHFLGALSYIVYLIHAGLYIPYTYILENVSSELKIIYFSLYIMCSMTISIIIYYTIDRFSEIKRRDWIGRLKKLNDENSN